MRNPQSDTDFRMLSEAVNAWFTFYSVEPDEQASNTLTSAARKLFDGGCRTVEDLSTMLIGTYVGVWATRINAPTSASIH
jgi:hypothetical protein